MVHLLYGLKREPEVFDKSFLSHLLASVVLTCTLLCISYSGIYYGTLATVPMMSRNVIAVHLMQEYSLTKA